MRALRPYQQARSIVLYEPVLYGIFATIVTSLLAMDLWVARWESFSGSLTKPAAVWTAIWTGCAIIFGLVITRFHGGETVVVEYL
jgi:hypothetical protein